MIRLLSDKVYQLTYKVPGKVVPPVNGFLILGREPVLIDGGTSNDESFSAFQTDLASIGMKTADIGEVLVTHNHIDHVGLASRLAGDNRHLKVHIHEEEWSMVCASDSDRKELQRLLGEVICSWGVPPEIVELMKEKLITYLRLGGGIPRDQVLPYPEKAPLKVGGIELEAIHSPGHTEGLVCLWWPDKQKLFSNDQVLEDITPNPTIYLKGRNGKRCGLADYLHSLSFIENLPVKQVLPGHGLPFGELKARIDEIHGLTHDRRRKITQNMIATEEPSSILDITLKTWGEMDPVSTFLGAREVHGFMEMMTDEGVVNVEKDGAVNRYAMTAPLVNNEPRLSQLAK
jgi:glyoxylase-like metal-dependent hydrolase (beta-lactamase superfamily II)